MSNRPKLGKTNSFPRGKLNKYDEGGVQMACLDHEGNVILDFGTPVKWIGMPPDQARALAAALVEHAEAAEKYGH